MLNILYINYKTFSSCSYVAIITFRVYANVLFVFSTESHRNTQYRLRASRKQHVRPRARSTSHIFFLCCEITLQGNKSLISVELAHQKADKHLFVAFHRKVRIRLLPYWIFICCYKITIYSNSTWIRVTNK